MKTRVGVFLPGKILPFIDLITRFGCESGGIGPDDAPSMGPEKVKCSKNLQFLLRKMGKFSKST